ncbi:malic enzyme, NAD binding domain protein [Burkholderia ambifaria AMMD]|uniref:Malate dehydrogenase (Oxaloacetate-decarboxylating) (NADP(+))/Phosphate acetyltransferase n=1 Tax=Burkholderia ambifaria (strain ATCC BAA-244 / DSM 16087 / CCUG 44356 / LMG 19182 / AMMD) TaxID=339670 RepID=Q0B761_BURCM|nr:NADP-dependent malic enzyme [Burkholderia ambifaria]ABI90012.1 Malate dehydrogenase (oxaloacetate-decarboxylating) (NADP(+))/Phosphate acetyltransferase [Burkholderia ambifaria AMMD]AJY24721.1 malic enzyme, NAD binding domain protein [Burkholderia ambifaria AMMD]MBR7930553.1 NADP-dependent malic enzyme [Burkholderia ambifaria]PEH68089.1 NADP-dependent malic enzyme [Burkholderia ambifaria]QQC07353.1 NADP-dependent malic enzyme [Burkholderia ambifaria]
MKQTETQQQAAYDYHEFPTPGKISVVASKPLVTQRDLALAYTPGVASVCEAIAADPLQARRFTSRGNLVGVITNGTAVLGLGNIGALASKPVMEGKAVLFKKFAGIDVFDIEINETDPDKLVDIIAGLEPTFGGINLEDIKAPECFTVERKLRERMKIPVFHDDQHGTAITVAAAFINGLKVVGKSISEVKVVTSGAGAAALACLDLLVDLGLPVENIWATDIEGVVYRGRTTLMDPAKERFAQPTDARTLAEVIGGADVFLGLSVGGILSADMLKAMAARPLILALANPTPEIFPELAHATRDDVVIATGRSDFPNQVNNVLCFPYIFRGALDVGATTITREMEIAAVHAIAGLAEEEQNDVVAAAYGGDEVSFGPQYLIPKPFDPRLIVRIAPAVAKAAIEGGVATRPLEDLDAYVEQLQQFVYHSGAFMKPLFAAARQLVRDGGKARIVFTEGEDERVLRAVQVIVDEKLARPILVGRPEVLLARIERFGLRLRLGQDVEVTNPEYDERFPQYWTTYWELRCRDGISKEMARVEMRRRLTLIGAMMVRLGDADGMICGTVGEYHNHLRFVDEVIGRKPDASTYAAMNILLLNQRTVALVDTHVNDNPDAEQIAEFTIAAARQMEWLNLTPKVALLSRSNFGSGSAASGVKMRQALEIIRAQAPDIEADGEMHGDCALDEGLRARLLPMSPLKGAANLLVCPNVDAGNIAYNLLKTEAGSNVAVGPFLLGVNAPVNILTSSATVRRIVNMTALTVIEANRNVAV